jgi:hypothetical protein
MITQVMAYDDLSFVYKGEDRSLVDWENLDEGWLDYSKWKRDYRWREKIPQWTRALRDKRLIEKVGVVLDCIGICKVIDGIKGGEVRVGYRSKVKEKEEFITDIGSYSWIYLMDGSLLRISPSSSVTFKEINLTKNEFFIYLRINHGNVVWISRDKREFIESDERETDPLFLPLALLEANVFMKYEGTDESDLYSSFKSFDSELSLIKHKRLNGLIRENNKVNLKKDTYAFVVMPNGTLFDKNIFAEFVVNSASNAYIKLRDKRGIYQGEEVKESEKRELYLRDYLDDAISEIDVGSWYEIDDRGKAAKKLEWADFFIGEVLTKRVPTIMMGREILFKEYSKPLYTAYSTELDFSQTTGYRLWRGSIAKKEGEIFKRAEFLKEYTRRIETTHLREFKNFKSLIESRGYNLKTYTHGVKSYQDAIDNYFTTGQEKEQYQLDQKGRVLNSTKRDLWKTIQVNVRNQKREQIIKQRKDSENVGGKSEYSGKEKITFIDISE